jgi:putative hydrolase of the HAD superfamily
MKEIKSIIFDWGDTLMRDFDFKGPMYCWSHIEVIPDVKNVLCELRKKYTLAVASNAGESNNKLMISALTRGEINQYFTYFFTSTELGFEKPDLRFFQKILEEVNCLPDQCIMVGNDYEKDIIPAKSLGMKTILFDEKNQYDSTEYADYKFDKMLQLTDIIKINF